MKKLYICLLLFILFENPLFAQYENLLEDGRRWVTSIMTVDDDEEMVKWIVYDEGYSAIRNMIINGATVINDITYKKLYASKLLYDNDWTIINKLEALIRYKNGKYLYRFLNKENITWYKTEFPNNFDGDDYILFDENYAIGDTTNIGYEVITEINDTLDYNYSNNKLKYWKIKTFNNDLDYSIFFDNIKWIQGVGFPTTIIPHKNYDYDCRCEDVLLFCIASNGDTIYRNKKFWHPEATNISMISSVNLSFKQKYDKFIVTLSTDVSIWSAALYNSNGIKVTHKSGSGNEIILPTTSKGTHILAIKADGKLIKKKVLVK